MTATTTFLLNKYTSINVSLPRYPSSIVQRADQCFFVVFCVSIKQFGGEKSKRGNERLPAMYDNHFFLAIVYHLHPQHPILRPPVSPRSFLSCKPLLLMSVNRIVINLEPKLGLLRALQSTCILARTFAFSSKCSILFMFGVRNRSIRVSIDSGECVQCRAMQWSDAGKYVVV